MLDTLKLVEDRKAPNRWRIVDVANSTLAAIWLSDTGLGWTVIEAVDPGTPVLEGYFPTRDEAFAAYKQLRLGRFLRDQAKRGTTGVGPNDGDN